MKGGYKPGAGRPRKSGPLATAVTAKYDNPKPYLLDIMNDPSLDVNTRMRAAGLLLPYTCERMADRRVGKKELEAEAAKAATQSEEWGDDLRVATSQH